MTESSWPFDNADTTETQYSTLFRRLQTNGVYGTTETTDLKAYADSSGMNVKLPPGVAFVRGFMYQNDALKTIPVTPSASAARIDVLALRLDPANNAVSAVMIDGQPGSGVRPDLVQSETGIYEEVISELTVGANTSTVPASATKDRRRFMSHHFGVWETTNRPVNPRRGTPGFNLTLGYAELWNGTTWTPLAPTSFPASGLSGTIPDINLPGRIAQLSQVTTDWNTAETSGWYVSQGGQVINSPNDGNWWFGEVIRGYGPYCVQNLYWMGEDANTVDYCRRRVRNAAGVWGAWHRASLNVSEITAINNVINGAFATNTSVDQKLLGKLNTAAILGQSNLPFRTAGGFVQMVPAGTSAPYTKVQHVTFPAGRFTGSPVITLGINTGAQTDTFVGYQNRTPQGFDLFIKRDDKTSTEVAWFAYDSINS